MTDDAQSSSVIVTQLHIILWTMWVVSLSIGSLRLNCMCVILAAAGGQQPGAYPGQSQMPGYGQQQQQQQAQPPSQPPQQPGGYGQQQVQQPPMQGYGQQQGPPGVYGQGQMPQQPAGGYGQQPGMILHQLHSVVVFL